MDPRDAIDPFEPPRDAIDPFEPPRDAIDPFEPWIPGSNQATPGHDQGGVVLTRLEPWP